MSVIEEVSKKTGISKEKIEKDWEQKLKEVKEAPELSGLSEAEQTKRAEIKLLSFYRKILQTGASEFEGYIFEYEDARDRNDKKRQKAMEAIKKDKNAAIAEKLCDQDGIILAANGKPLSYWIARGINGVVIKKGSSRPKKFVLTYTSSEAGKIPVPPIHQYVKFRARVREEKEGLYILDSLPSQGTVFEAYNPENKPSVEDVLKFYEVRKNLDGVEKNQEIVFEAMVDTLDLENSSGFKKITVSPEDANLDVPPIVVFMPKQFEFDKVEGLGEQTKAVIWGKYSGVREDGSIAVNGQGIWIYPSWRTKKPKEVTKEEVAKTVW